MDSHNPLRHHKSCFYPCNRYKQNRSFHTCVDFLYLITSCFSKFLLGLDQLSHWLQNDKPFGLTVIFVLIFITTFRGLSIFILINNKFTRFCSACPSVLYAHYIIRLYFWCMDWCYYLLFCSPIGGAYCIPHITDILSRRHLPMAVFHHYDQTRSSCCREAPKVTFPHSISALPL
jgi:hypothetical protein